MGKTARPLEDVLEAMLPGVVVADRRGVVEELNSVACRMLEHSREAVAGRPVEELVTADHPIARLARQARPRIPLVEDLGSGTLVDLRAEGLPAESFAPARLSCGADALCFSGDKLLGGPQAGLILTREAEAARRLRHHPLARALRLGKLPLAALDWTLRALAEGRRAELPVLAQLLAPAAQVAERARALAARLAGEPVLAGEAPGLAVDVAETRAPAGGGSLPGFDLPSFAVRLRPAADGGGAAGRLAAALRRGRPPVIARLAEGAVLLDARTLLPGDEEHIAAALRAAVSSMRRN